jgi:hypothetical protein
MGMWENEIMNKCLWVSKWWVNECEYDWVSPFLTNLLSRSKIRLTLPQIILTATDGTANFHLSYRPITSESVIKISMIIIYDFNKKKAIYYVILWVPRKSFGHLCANNKVYTLRMYSRSTVAHRNICWPVYMSVGVCLPNTYDHMLLLWPVQTDNR